MYQMSMLIWIQPRYTKHNTKAFAFNSFFSENQVEQRPASLVNYKFWNEYSSLQQVADVLEGTLQQTVTIIAHYLIALL